MSEALEERTITLLSGEIASYKPRNIPTATFDVLPHEGDVTIHVWGGSIDDRYSREIFIRLDGQRIHRAVISGSFDYKTTRALSTGTHTLEVEITAWVGSWEVNADIVYKPTVQDASDELFLVILGGVTVVGTAIASWYLTDGFTKIPSIAMPSLPF